MGYLQDSPICARHRITGTGQDKYAIQINFNVGGWKYVMPSKMRTVSGAFARKWPRYNVYYNPRTAAIDSNGNVYIGGSVTSYNYKPAGQLSEEGNEWSPTSVLIKLDKDGNVDEDFVVKGSTGNTITGLTRKVVLIDDDYAVLCGVFSEPNESYIIKVNLSTGFYAGGFTPVDRYNGIFWSGGNPSYLNDMAYHDGYIYAVGQFYSYRHATDPDRGGYMKVSASTGTATGKGLIAETEGTEPYGRKIAVTDDGKIYVYSTDTNTGPISLWNPTSDEWETHSGFSGTPLSLEKRGNEIIACTSSKIYDSSVGDICDGYFTGFIKYGIGLSDGTILVSGTFSNYDDGEVSYDVGCWAKVNDDGELILLPDYYGSNLQESSQWSPNQMIEGADGRVVIVGEVTPSLYYSGSAGNLDRVVENLIVILPDGRLDHTFGWP